MADAAILRSAVESVPKDWTLPAGTELLLKSVAASMDGSGAGAAFFPALEIIDPSGAVMSTAVSPTSVAAGGSADVSWFLVGGGGGGSGVLSGAVWGTYFTSTVTVPAGSGSTADFSFDLGTPLLDLTNPAAPTFLVQGVYAVDAWVQCTDTWATPSVAGGELSFSSPTGYNSRSTGGVDHSGVLRNFSVKLVAQAAVGTQLQLTFDNFDTISHQMFSNEILVQLVGTY